MARFTLSPNWNVPSTRGSQAGTISRKHSSGKRRPMSFWTRYNAARTLLQRIRQDRRLALRAGAWPSGNGLSLHFLLGLRVSFLWEHWRSVRWSGDFSVPSSFSLVLSVVHLLTLNFKFEISDPQ